ncbi:hypothetical protein ACFOVU_28640 [Nocardiopsis sediminis]|uniref:ABC transporter permease n=1 Tax=Nocardiopsis sediminis TaxID=1778267 RepID=A0ABV8FWU3_9ACTN
MTRMAISAGRLPLYALDLARRYWAPLLCVYAAGTFLHDMVLRGMVRLSEIDPTVALLGLSISVLVTLTTTIIMFHMLRPGLPTVDIELVGSLPPERTTLSARERHVVDAVAMAILPFLLFYSAWGMFGEEFRLYSQGLLNERGLDGYLESGRLSAIGLPLVFAVGSYLLRMLCERFYVRRENKVLGVLTALFEANWMFFAVFSVVHITTVGQEWLTGRVFWVGVQTEILDSVRALGELTALPLEFGYLAALEGVATAWGHLKDGLVGPLLWLTIAAVIYGAEVESSEQLFSKGTRVGRIEERVGRLPGVATGVGRFAQRGVREKYTPFLNAFRFILRVSPVFYLSFCLYYVLLELGFEWLHRGILVLIGPNDFLGWWWPWLPPIDFAVGALHELLRVCLLAATFEVALRRVGESSTGRRARRASRAA